MSPFQYVQLLAHQAAPYLIPSPVIEVTRTSAKDLKDRAEEFGLRGFNVRREVARGKKGRNRVVEVAGPDD